MNMLDSSCRFLHSLRSVEMTTQQPVEMTIQRPVEMTIKGKVGLSGEFRIFEDCQDF